MATKKKTKAKTEVAESETTELYYTQNVTINDNHGTIIFKQSGQPTTVPPKPPGH